MIFSGVLRIFFLCVILSSAMPCLAQVLTVAKGEQKIYYEKGDLITFSVKEDNSRKHGEIVDITPKLITIQFNEQVQIPLEVIDEVIINRDSRGQRLAFGLGRVLPWAGLAYIGIDAFNTNRRGGNEQVFIPQTLVVGGSMVGLGLIMRAVGRPYKHLRMSRGWQLEVIEKKKDEKENDAK